MCLNSHSSSFFLSSLSSFSLYLFSPSHSSSSLSFIFLCFLYFPHFLLSFFPSIIFRGFLSHPLFFSSFLSCLLPVFLYSSSSFASSVSPPPFLLSFFHSSISQSFFFSHPFRHSFPVFFYLTICLPLRCSFFSPFCLLCIVFSLPSSALVSPSLLLTKTPTKNFPSILRTQPSFRLLRKGYRGQIWSKGGILRDLHAPGRNTNVFQLPPRLLTAQRMLQKDKFRVTFDPTC